ncbi:hypothetical protein B0I32_1556 [Nonomuraea fuscirosea]|uniref:Uncharacterized protein n=1 Tax=Nonomuraea fuscirosea TaxID=1291556 RepID=A0A2T0LKQ4_9ACTN|nr:hypothetical protein [Nonomuraea fuscirosea]PRX43540.1 hypothetical protein B0I32_1556 [Nonomuraea fuscirosea]
MIASDPLEVTDVCIADLVKETHRVLEDHGHHAGTAQDRFTQPAALLDFLDTTSAPHEPRSSTGCPTRF